MDGSLNVGMFRENGSLKHWNIVSDGITGRVESGGTRYYYLTDHLGSTRTILRDDGTVVGSEDYYPFGLKMPMRSYVTAESDSTKELFTGKELDNETGLYYFGGTQQRSFRQSHSKPQWLNIFDDGL